MSMLKQLFRWQKGRQQSGYDKMLLAGAYWPLKFDCYLLRFPQGCEVPPHKDTVSSGRHYRLNIVLKQAKKGGDFICAAPIYQHSRIKFFRQDLCEHVVTKVEQGSRCLVKSGYLC